MSITDQTILSEIQRVTLEGVGDGGATWPSGLWSAAEILWYLNRRQDRFLAETGLLWKRAETAITINQSDQAQPSDWAGTLLVAYKSAAGSYSELPKMDAGELDLATPTWPAASSATPRAYTEIDGSTLTSYVVPIPTDAGSALERYYIYLGTVLDASGVAFTVADEMVPAIKYGCLADMFGKVGPAQNLGLAAACEERWQESLELGKAMAQEGWFTL